MSKSKAEVLTPGAAACAAAGAAAAEEAAEEELPDAWAEALAARAAKMGIASNER